MNIFFTSNCPLKSAKYLDDKRVVKMCLETAQLLSTAIVYHVKPELFENSSKENRKARNEIADKLGIYKPTHINHPSNVWARQSKDNYRWLLHHFLFLTNEYKARYDKTHKCSQLFGKFMMLIKHIPKGKLTTFANCSANQEKGLDFRYLPVHEAYRQYLEARFKTDKRKPTWYKKERKL